jgi:hypothetical protein
MEFYDKDSKDVLMQERVENIECNRLPLKAAMAVIQGLTVDLEQIFFAVGRLSPELPSDSTAFVHKKAVQVGLQSWSCANSCGKL